MGPTSGLVTAYPIRGTCVHSFCKWSSCSSILCFLCSVLQTIVYPFNLFFFGHCIVCHSLMYGFLFLLLYLQAFLYIEKNINEIYLTVINLVDDKSTL